MTESGSGQSKPMRAARREILAAQRGEGEGDPVEDAIGPAAGLPLSRLMRLPGLVLRRGRPDFGLAEHMRMAPLHFVGDRLRDIVETKKTGFLSHAGMEHDLEQEIAELVFERRHVAALNGVGDLIGFLDRIGRDRREILFAVPRAALHRVA